MNKHTPVIINGVAYDAKTGLQLSDYQVASAPEMKQPVATASNHKEQPAHNLHARTHRSQTLRREHVKNPSQTSVSKPIQESVKRSPLIARFATDVKPLKPAITQRKVISDIGPVKHPLQDVVRHRTTAPKSALAPTSSQQLKHQAISQAMEKSIPNKKQVKQSWRPKTFSIVSASFAIVLLAGYFTYLSLPNISVRVAAAQAGIAASYPSYHPQGYRLNGPVAYADGEVTMQFDSNTNSENFSVNQTKSSWDSSALLANYVEPAAGEEYVTYTDSGLTIYIYDKGAAWVSNGILHTIEGDASLSNDQVRRIATSM
ncbi:MAG: hypothetical protein ACSLEY_02855 [Candidatus Saccharimonadales bacterium]